MNLNLEDLQTEDFINMDKKELIERLKKTKPIMDKFTFPFGDKDLTEEEQSAMFACDSRPNHIADMQVHTNIFNTVNAVIQGTKTGILYLDT